MTHNALNHMRAVRGALKGLTKGISAVWARLRALGRDDSGQSALFAVCTMTLIIVAIAYTYNFGLTVSERVRLQNAADSAAYSGAVVQANTLSAIAWLNSCQTHIHAQMQNLMFDVVRHATAAATVQWGRYAAKWDIDKRESVDARPFKRATWRGKIFDSNIPFPEGILPDFLFRVIPKGQDGFERYGRFLPLDGDYIESPGFPGLAPLSDGSPPRDIREGWMRWMTGSKWDRDKKEGPDRDGNATLLIDSWTEVSPNIGLYEAFGSDLLDVDAEKISQNDYSRLVRRFGRDYLAKALADAGHAADNDGLIDNSAKLADATIHALLPEAGYLIGQRLENGGVRRGEMWIRQLSAAAAGLAEAMPLLIRDEIIYQARMNAPPGTLIALYPEMLDPDPGRNETASGARRMPSEAPVLEENDVGALNAFFRYEYYGPDNWTKKDGGEMFQARISTENNRFLVESRRQAMRMGYEHVDGENPFFPYDSEKTYFFDEAAGKPFEKTPLRRIYGDTPREREDMEAYSASVACWNKMDRDWQQPQNDIRFYERGKASKNPLQINYQKSSWTRGEAVGNRRCTLGSLQGFCTLMGTFDGPHAVRTARVDDAADGHWHSPHVHGHSSWCQHNWTTLPICPKLAIMGFGSCLFNGYKSQQVLVHTAMLHTDGATYGVDGKAHLHCAVAKSNKTLLSGLFKKEDGDDEPEPDEEDDEDEGEKLFWTNPVSGIIHTKKGIGTRVKFDTKSVPNGPCIYFYPAEHPNPAINAPFFAHKKGGMWTSQGSRPNVAPAELELTLKRAIEWVEGYGKPAYDGGVAGGCKLCVGNRSLPQVAAGEPGEPVSDEEKEAEKDNEAKENPEWRGQLYPDFVPGMNTPKVCYYSCPDVTFYIFGFPISVCRCAKTWDAPKMSGGVPENHGTRGCNGILGWMMEYFGPLPFNLMTNWPGMGFSAMGAFSEKAETNTPLYKDNGAALNPDSSWRQAIPGHWWTTYDWEALLSGDWHFWNIPAFIEEVFRDMSMVLGLEDGFSIGNLSILPPPEARAPKPRNGPKTPADDALDFTRDVDFVKLLKVDTMAKQFIDKMAGNLKPPFGVVVQKVVVPIVNKQIVAPLLDKINEVLNKWVPDGIKKIINVFEQTKAAIKRHFNRRGHHAIMACPLCAAKCPVCPPREYESILGPLINAIPGIRDVFARNTMHGGRDHDGDSRSDVAMDYRQVLMGHDLTSRRAFEAYTLGADIDDGAIDNPSKAWNANFARDRFVREWTSPSPAPNMPPDTLFAPTVVATENVFRYGITVALHLPHRPVFFNALFQGQNQGQLAVATARAGFAERDDAEGGIAATPRIITGAFETRSGGGEWTLDAIWDEFLAHPPKENTPAGNNRTEGNLYYPHWGAKLVSTRYAVIGAERARAAAAGQSPDGRRRIRQHEHTAGDPASWMAVETTFWNDFGNVFLLDTDGAQTTRRLRAAALGSENDDGDRMAWAKYVEVMVQGEHEARELMPK